MIVNYLMCMILIFFMQDFEAFDNAVEDDRLEEFLKLK